MALAAVITISPLVFTGAEDYLDTWFDPLAVGATTISITQPPAFLPPAGRTSIVATVDPGVSKPLPATPRGPMR